MIKDLLPTDPVTVGHYRLLGRLGAGGMGQVYLARSPGGRLVAVKVIRPELGGEPGFRARFAREVAAARNVGGMFTALVVDADVESPVPWLATAYVAGPSLSEAVEDQGPLPVDSLLTLFAGLAEGLQAIHAAGVVHRDLKPSNVLLAHDGPRVIDFGISRAREASMLTQTGMVMGSPGYLSPEQAEGSAVGAPSDVFSLGAVMTYAATAEGPFGSGPTPALMYRVVNREPDLTRVPDQIRPLIERCLTKAPADRPTPSELLDQLGEGAVGAVGEPWLPEPYTMALNRYVPTMKTPPTPPLAASQQSPAVAAQGGSPAPSQPGVPAPDVPDVAAAEPAAAR
uniref:serine/threonine-protein kinase n=1 Tax=Trebonia sp. TaxID=2767075 RepID=UPI002624A5D3